ncbi:MAG: cation transporter [Firmicutes bacterium]|nr:cation transporter [Bacillota bacterium]MBQ2312497.1 cation transporter [Bacillota bacterium]MBQ3931970.1 cation transporter [Bacillota bacterium]
MRKSFKVNGIDCANCAAKLERGIAKIKGVESCAVVFATQKLVLEAPDDKFEEVLKEAVEVTRKLEPDWEIVL